MNHVVRGAAFIVMGEENSTAQDHPPGTAVAPKGSESAVADWSKPTSYEQIIATASADTTSTAGNATTLNATLAYAQGDDTGMMGNNTGMMNATLAYAQETVSMPAGSANPSNPEFFVPAETSVPTGTTVTWSNDDTTIHTVVEGSPQAGAGETPAFDSGIVAPGATWENTFDTAGEFDYYCSLHPFMVGKVTVT
jgi:plastocyanin